MATLNADEILAEYKKKRFVEYERKCLLKAI